MREILFRAKRIDNGEWVEGQYAFILNPITESGEPIKHLICNGTNIFNDEIDLETLCQYTGMKDKNGNRIWENDIVVCKQYIGGNFVDYHIEYGYVEMKYGAFGIHRSNPDAYYRPFKDWLEDYEYEVIGNIFDTPELLKGE